MPIETDFMPALSDTVVPPVVHGTAELSGRAYAGVDLNAMLGWLGPSARPLAQAADVEVDTASWLFDASIIHQLSFRRAAGLALQARALAQSRLYRVMGKMPRAGRTRILAICAPGDLMVNTPLDFITNELDVRLDMLFICPDMPLPQVIPDHDVAVFCASQADPALLSRLQRLYAMWPRPALNDPGLLPGLARDTLARSLAGVSEIRSPMTLPIDRVRLDRHLRRHETIDLGAEHQELFPCLLRPHHSHAGNGLARCDSDADLAAYLKLSHEDFFFLTAFEDYADADGLYRKRRVAFVDRQPFLCHMAISEHWMVHYLNAGMTESATKRAMEQAAMEDFHTGFARRHQAAFAALHQRIGFDYYSIDCAETRDGRLLVFEADTAAIIHLMDPPDLFPYKQTHMRQVFESFAAMLDRHAGRSADFTPAGVRTAPPVPV
jgi:hypothetical protein